MNNLEQAVNALKNNKTFSVKTGPNEVLVATKNAIVIRIFDQSMGLTETPIVAKLNGQLIGNSARLDTVLRLREFRSSVAVIPEQEALTNVLPMIPFSTIKEAGLSLASYRELDKSNDETVWLKQKANWQSENQVKFLETRSNVRNVKAEVMESNDKLFSVTFEESRHFTGARLFTCADAMGTVARFLLDIDREEINHGIFNPFMVRLKPDSEANTIAQAYAELKPQAVIDAENQGLTVIRQGEWFFIPVVYQNLCEGTFNERTKGLKDWQKQGRLQVGRNRPNIVQMFQQMSSGTCVKGKIEHSGREHRTVTLEKWHLAVPNTASVSWQVSGDID